MALQPKDTTFNWEIPVSTHSSHGNVADDLLILTRIIPAEHGSKWNTKSIDFKLPVLEKHFETVEGNKRIGLSFQKDRLIIVFDPPQNVPSYKLSKNAKARSLSNTHIIEKIYDYFKFSKETTKYCLKIKFWADVDGLKCYALIPYDFKTRLPLFEDELKGES